MKNTKLYENSKKFNCDCHENHILQVKHDEGWIYILVNGKEEIILNPDTSKRFIEYVIETLHNPMTV